MALHKNLCEFILFDSKRWKSPEPSSICFKLHQDTKLSSRRPWWKRKCPARPPGQVKLLATLPVGCRGGIGAGVAVQVWVTWDTTRFSLVYTPLVTVGPWNLYQTGQILSFFEKRTYLAKPHLPGLRDGNDSSGPCFVYQRRYGPVETSQDSPFMQYSDVGR